MRFRNKILDAKEIEEMVFKIRDLLEQGNSISLSRKLVCGNSFGTLTVERVMNHPAYCEALNAYMKRIGKPIQYELVNGLLKHRRVA